jgi:hypothetical protein
VSKSSTNDHTGYEQRSIAVAFPSKEKLPSRTAPGESKCQPGEYHPSEVPQSIGMSNRLVSETRVELTESKVGNESHDNKCENAVEQMIVTKQDGITHGTHGTETAPLRQETDDKSSRQRNGKQRVLTAGSGLGEKDGAGRITFGVTPELGCCNDQD